MQVILFMVAKCTYFFKLSQNEMRNVFRKKNVQMEAVALNNSRINIVERCGALRSGDVGSAYVSAVVTDCFIYLFIISEKRSLDALQDKDKWGKKRDLGD